MPHTRPVWRACLGLGALLLPLAGASLLLGVADLGAQVFALSRLPRTLAVLLTGAALAIAGVVMQQLVRNRFVEPGTTGTAEGAALGLLAITLWAPGAALWLKMGVASLSAMAASRPRLRMAKRSAAAQASAAAPPASQRSS